MAKTDPINPNRPASSGETPRLGDNVIRSLGRAIAEQQAVDHFMGTDSGSGYTDDAAGQHKKITFYGPLSAKPTAAANKSFLYSKDVANKTELFWEDEDGDELQLTLGGVFNPVIACGLTGNQTIAGVKTFSGACVFGDGSALATAAAPDANAKIANKKYVDDKVAIIAAEIPDDDAFGSWLSRSNNTVYPAATDGFVNAFNPSELILDIKGLTDGSNPPTTVRMHSQLNSFSIGVSNGGSIMFPVKKGDYWKVTGAATVYWIPIGG